jgi:hypothetical protein
MTDDKPKFFQNEKKFVVGKAYETLMVQSPRWGTYPHNLETCDEIGHIIPNTEIFLGYYVKSISVGYGDNRTRYDYFTNAEGKEISHCLSYEGTTRYREVKTNVEEQIPYLKNIEDVKMQKARL